MGVVATPAIAKEVVHVTCSEGVVPCLCSSLANDTRPMTLGDENSFFVTIEVLPLV